MQSGVLLSRRRCSHQFRAFLFHDGLARVCSEECERPLSVLEVLPEVAKPHRLT